MQKIAILFLILFTQAPLYGQKDEDHLLSENQIVELYDQIISEIEYLDAEAIAVRNSTKSVSWEAYKEYHRQKFEEVKTTNELKKRFEDFGKGFVSGHSDFEFLLSFDEKPEVGLKANIKLGYTYPKLSFFDLNTRQTISKINEVAIDTIFKDFVNYQTLENGINDCQKRFKLRFESGEILTEGKLPTNKKVSMGIGIFKEVTSGLA